MAVYCFTQAIQPGKSEEARAIFQEIQRDRREEYEASRRRLGIREERVWFQSLPDGQMAVVYWEGDDPHAALQAFASSDDPFDEWLRKRGRNVYNFESQETLKEDEQVFEAEVRRGHISHGAGIPRISGPLSIRPPTQPQMAVLEKE